LCNRRNEIVVVYDSSRIVIVVERKFAPATVKSYLNSLRHWFMYVLSEKVYEADTQTKNEVTKMNATITQWIGTYKKESDIYGAVITGCLCNGAIILFFLPLFA
jgi:hypothetical protein